MAKDPIKGLQDFEARLKALDTEWSRRGFAKSFMADIAQQIRKRTRLGKGVNDSGEYVKLESLKDTTVQNRKRYKKNLSEFTTVKRSNLTATGQLLDNIRYVYQQGVFRFFFGGTRTKELPGKGRGVKNAQVAAQVSKARPFFTLSKTETNQFARRLKSEFLKIIRGR